LGSPPQPQYTFSGNGTYNNNLIDTANYDAAGNMHQDFTAGTPNTYTYDAEGRVYQVSGSTSATYVYDGLGRRVKGPNYEYVYDLYGNVASVLTPGSGNHDTVNADEIWAGSRHLASYFASSTYFTHADQLGAERIRTDVNGNACQTMTNLPFGDSQTYVTNTCHDSDGRTFGGLEYDSENGLEHTLFRKYYSVPGRWMTPDPAGTAFADLTNPQSWNRYAYALNSPLSYTDPAGLFCVWDDGSYDSSEDLATGSPDLCASVGGHWFDGSPSDYGLNADWSPDANLGFVAQWFQDPGYTIQGQATAPLPLPNDDVPIYGIFGWGQTVLAGVSQRTAGFPDICTGGAFVYAGAQGKMKGDGHGFVGYLGNYDSSEGWSNNILVEGSNGNASGGAAGGTKGIEGLWFIPAAEAGGGLVGVSRNGLSIGGYAGTPEKFPVGFGAGAYFTISTIGHCTHRSNKG
jgi:RHS repeat-associated protein